MKFNYIAQFCVLKIKKMKNTSLIINVILALAVAVLYYLHFSCKTNCEQQITDQPIPDSQPQTTLSLEKINSESNIGYINIDSLQDKYKLFEELTQKLKAKQTKYENEIAAKMTAFEKKVKDFQLKAPSMSQFEGQTKQQELAEEEQKLYKLREDFTVKFQEEEAKLNEEFQKTVKDYIKKHNQSTDFDIIIGASQVGNIVLDHKPGIDITQIIVDGLNKEYNSKKAKK